jgi:hypothetical protein
MVSLETFWISHQEREHRPVRDFKNVSTTVFLETGKDYQVGWWREYRLVRYSRASRLLELVVQQPKHEMIDWASIQPFRLAQFTL